MRATVYLLCARHFARSISFMNRELQETSALSAPWWTWGYRDSWVFTGFLHGPRSGKRESQNSNSGFLFCCHFVILKLTLWLMCNCCFLCFCSWDSQKGYEGRTTTCSIFVISLVVCSVEIPFWCIELLHLPKMTIRQRRRRLIYGLLKAST